MDSIFTKIIKGEIPAYKIYENDKTLAFLDIYPAQPGHTLIVPKNQVDRLENLPNDDYLALMQTVKKVMHRVVEVFGQEYRACLKLEGFDVAHAHVHVIPCRTAIDFWAKQRMNETPDALALEEVTKRLKF
ncbi:MAG: HIT family protein [Candidatus Woesebacteria bacterium]